MLTADKNPVEEPPLRPLAPISIYLPATMNHLKQSAPLQASAAQTASSPAPSLNFSVNAILSGGGGCSNGRSHSTSSNCSSTSSNGSSGTAGYGGQVAASRQQSIYDTGQQPNQHLASAAFLRITAAAAASAASTSGKNTTISRHGQYHRIIVCSCCCFQVQ